MGDANETNQKQLRTLFRAVYTQLQKILTLNLFLSSITVVGFLVAIFSFYLDRSESNDSTIREETSVKIGNVNNKKLDEIQETQAGNHKEMITAINELLKKDMDQILHEFIEIASEEEDDLLFLIKNGTPLEVEKALSDLANLADKKEKANRIMVENILKTHKVVGVAALSSDTQLAIKYFEKALAITPDEWSLNFRLAQLHGDLNNYKQAKKYYLIAVEKIGVDNGYRAAAYNNLGNIENRLNNLDSAYEYYRKGLEIDIRNNLTPGIILGFIKLGGVENQRENYELAEEWYLKSLEVARDSDYTRYSSMVYRSLAFLALEKNDSATYENYLKQSINSVFEVSDNGRFKAETLMLLGYSRFKNDDYIEAERKFVESVEVYEAIEKQLTEDKLSLSSLYYNLGAIHYLWADYVASETFFSSQLRILREIGSKNDIKKTLESIGLSAMIQNKTSEACEYWTEAITYSVSKNSRSLGLQQSAFDSNCIK